MSSFSKASSDMSAYQRMISSFCSCSSVYVSETGDMVWYNGPFWLAGTSICRAMVVASEVQGWESVAICGIGIKLRCSDVILVGT